MERKRMYLGRKFLNESKNRILQQRGTFSSSSPIRHVFELAFFVPIYSCSSYVTGSRGRYRIYAVCNATKKRIVDKEIRCLPDIAANTDFSATDIYFCVTCRHITITITMIIFINQKFFGSKYC